MRKPTNKFRDYLRQITGSALDAPTNVILVNDPWQPLWIFVPEVKLGENRRVIVGHIHSDAGLDIAYLFSIQGLDSWFPVAWYGFGRWLTAPPREMNGFIHGTWMKNLHHQGFGRDEAELIHCQFDPGNLVTTPGALAIHDRRDYLLRHLMGDWGDLCDEDKEANAFDLEHGGRLLSSYDTPEGKLWIITEADRSATTMLLPDEY